MKKTICIAGKNDIAVHVLEYCLEKYGKSEEYEVVASLTRNDDGKNAWQQSYRYFCNRNHVRTVELEELYPIDNLVFVSTEYDRIVKTEKFQSDRLFNIHFSLLPKYKGMYPSVLPILDDQEKTGVTLHVIRDGIDTGEIIEQREFEIDEEDTSLELYKKLIQYGTELVIEKMALLVSTEYQTRPQSYKHSSYNSPKRIDYENLSLETRASAYQIKNQIRAFAFRPYQLLTYHGNGIIDSAITDEVSNETPGTIISENATAIKISSIDYNIILYKDILTELLEAIASQKTDHAKSLCVSNKIINDQNEKGWTPLIVAVYHNNLEMVKYLLERGADPFITNYNGTNLLMYAKDCFMNTNDNSMFEYIIKLGISPKTRDYTGKSLIDYCKDLGIKQIGRNMMD